MPIFFFDVGGGVQRPDHDGVELINVDEAWAEAFRYAADLQNEPDSVFEGQRWSVVVKDDAGRFLFRLDFDQTA